MNKKTTRSAEEKRVTRLSDPSLIMPTGPELEGVHVALGFDLLLDPTDSLAKQLICNGVLEAPETDLVTRLVRPGDTCIDAACHIGYYACLLAHLVGHSGRLFVFDADPAGCESTRRNLTMNGIQGVQVIHTALGNRRGSTSFSNGAPENQAGARPLGAIGPPRETTTVPMVPLESFLEEQGIHHVRLLKLDVGGAERIVLDGLDRFLRGHRVDFVLTKCYDERLQLFGSSSEDVAHLLQEAGYLCWEYGTVNRSGWSLTSRLRSRGDCSYLFASPLIETALPVVSLVRPLGSLQRRYSQLENRSARWENETRQLEQETARLRQDYDKAQDEVGLLKERVRTHEDELARLQEEKQALERLWQAVESSAGWRLLDGWRRMRNRLAPEGTGRRYLYDSLLRRLRRKG